jgi:cytochrome c oxidase cbb3-type subunit 4
MTFETLRHFADTWGLLYLVVLFVGILAFTFRPGSKHKYDEAARLPLKHD